MFRLKTDIQASVRKIRTVTEAQIQKVKEVLAYIGERTVNDARTNGNYQDRTGNLRHSVGYSIETKQRRQLELYQPGASSEALKAGEEARKEIKKYYDINLFIFAGMHYAGFVEAKGYTVLSDYVPAKTEIKAFLKRSLKL